MLAWDDEILKLWLAKEDLHEALDKNASQCQEIFENTTKRCKDISARLPVVMFIITWREFILNGLKSNDEAGISIQHLTTLTKDKRPILTWDLEKRSLLNHPHYLEYPSPFKNPFHIKTTPSPIPTYLDRGVELTYIVTKLQTKKASR